MKISTAAGLTASALLSHPSTGPKPLGPPSSTLNGVIGDEMNIAARYAASEPFILPTPMQLEGDLPAFPVFPACPAFPNLCTPCPSRHHLCTLHVRTSPSAMRHFCCCLPRMASTPCEQGREGSGDSY